MTRFHAGLPAGQVHDCLQQALEVLCCAEKNAALWFAEVLSRHLYRELGYSSIHQYADQALGFSPSKTSQFIRLAGAFEELPKLKRSVASGEVGWTKAREVAKVATAGTEAVWVEKAKRSSRRQLEQEISQTRARAKVARTVDQNQQTLGLDEEETLAAAQVEIPVSVNLRFSPEQYARYEALVEKLRKTGVTERREELVLSAMAELLGNQGNRDSTSAKFTRVNAPVQIVVHKCEDCGGARIETDRGPKPLSPATIAAAECDARILEPGKRNTATIPPAKRRAVLIRDGYRCQSPGCNHTHFLEVHHIVPRIVGGSNAIDNLTTVCSSCHRLLHEKGQKSAGDFYPGKTPWVSYRE